MEEVEAQGLLSRRRDAERKVQLAKATGPSTLLLTRSGPCCAFANPTSGLWQTKFFYIKKIGIFVVTMAMGAGVLGLDYLSGSDAPLPSRITRISSDNIACI